jgi:hypothetical protein
MFGIRSPENFALPLFAKSISQFWRRWHMTLTLWLTDYVFTPLRMATRNLGKWGLVISITLNMTLIGLWHGLGVGFLLFGLIHAGYLVLDSLSSSIRRGFYRRNPLADHLTDVIGPFVVFAMVTFTLVFFRAEGVTKIAYQMQYLWEGLRSPLSGLREVFYGAGRLRCGLTGMATIALLLWEYLRNVKWKPAASIVRFSLLPLPVRWAAYYAAILIVFNLHLQSTHFIYVQF